MKKQLIIIGAGGHGKVIADIAMKMKQWKNIAFLDDGEQIEPLFGLKVLGKIKDAPLYEKDADFFVAVGNNVTREGMQEELERKGMSMATLIHPQAVMGQEVEIGAGSVVMAGVVINSSSKIGKGCILNTSCSLDHDNIIEDYVHISPGAHLAGTVRIGRRSWLGIGSIVSNNIAICGDCVIGAGAVVVKDICETGIYIGNPAKNRKLK